MKNTRTVGTIKKAGSSMDKMTDAQRELLDIIETFNGHDFELADISAITKKPIQRYGVSVRALCRLGFLEQTFRSPSGRVPNMYRAKRSVARFIRERKERAIAP